MKTLPPQAKATRSLPPARYFLIALPPVPSVKFHHTEQTITQHWVTIQLLIPAAELRDAEALWNEDSQRMFGHNPAAVSISINSSTEDNCRWVPPFNKGRKGIPSLKTRLESLRKALKSQPCRAIEVAMSGEVWERVLVVSSLHGITALEHCLGAISYHAYCWRNQQAAAKPRTSLDAFEQGLARGYRQERATYRSNLSAGGAA